MSQWIKFSERQPEWPEHGSFIAYDSVYGVHIQHGHRRYFNDNRLRNDAMWEITHWMPLPKPPDEDTKPASPAKEGTK